MVRESAAELEAERLEADARESRLGGWLLCIIGPLMSMGSVTTQHGLRSHASIAEGGALFAFGVLFFVSAAQDRRKARALRR